MTVPRQGKKKREREREQREGEKERRSLPTSIKEMNNGYVDFFGDII
jgi:hypothetical protein